MATQLSAQPDYDRDTAKLILQRLAGGETLLAITRDIGVHSEYFYAWKRSDPDLAAAFDEARIQGAHAIADEALRIVDGDDLEDMVPMNLDGVRGLVNRKTQLAAAGGDPVARARLRFEGRMKLLAKWFPAHYGDKLLHAGHDGGAIKSETALSVKELAAQLRARASGVVIDNEADNAPRALQYDVEVAGAVLDASGLERGGQGDRLAAPGTGLAKRRSRGVGGRGGALKRGASPETGGTPPPQIFSTNSSTSATSHLQTAQSPRQKGPTPENFAKENPQFPSDEDWAPEDYV